MANVTKKANGPAVLEVRERCARIALEQRCERGTPWDLACTTIADAIRNGVSHTTGQTKHESEQ